MDFKRYKQLNEMGMKISKLGDILPKNYLVKSLKKKSKELNPEKLKLEKINGIYHTLIENLKNLDWKDLKISNGNVSLPNYIKSDLNLLNKIVYSIKHIPINYLKQDMVNMLDAYNVWDVDITLDRDFNLNRTHFQGLPDSFLGFNLGYKIYRKLVDNVGHISSSFDASYEVQNIYRKLIEEPNLNCIIFEDSVMIIKNTIPTINKIKILNFFSNIEYDYIVYRRPMVLNKDIIMDTPLIKEIGLTKINEILKSNYLSRQ